MHIRDYRESDFDAVVRLDKSSAQEWRSLLERARFKPERNIMMVEVDGATVGFASIW